jgi:hypothetical protein
VLSVSRAQRGGFFNKCSKLCIGLFVCRKLGRMDPIDYPLVPKAGTRRPFPFEWALTPTSIHVDPKVNDFYPAVYTRWV